MTTPAPQGEEKSLGQIAQDLVLKIRQKRFRGFLQLNLEDEEAAKLVEETLRAATADKDALLREMVERNSLDTPERVCFYEQDFYVLSNFSAFSLMWAGRRFDTSEAAYHWEKFVNTDIVIATRIRDAISAHEAFKIAERNKDARRPDWDSVKVETMRQILWAKVEQHEYVKRKLLETGNRELVENSWRDDFWGWGPNKDGQNMLGKLWMEIRAALQHAREMGVL